VFECIRRSDHIEFPEYVYKLKSKDNSCVPSPVDRRWLASGSFGTSRLSMTAAGQRVVGLRLIRGDPYSPMLTMHWYICLLTLFLRCNEKIVQDTPAIRITRDRRHI
jgi:hypothetical protein